MATLGTHLTAISKAMTSTQGLSLPTSVKPGEEAAFQIQRQGGQDRKTQWEERAGTGRLRGREAQRERPGVREARGREAQSERPRDREAQGQGGHGERGPGPGGRSSSL